MVVVSKMNRTATQTQEAKPERVLLVTERAAQGLLSFPAHLPIPGRGGVGIVGLVWALRKLSVQAGACGLT